MKYIVGIDEVGRGPIAGPVTVCTFIMKADYDILKHFKNRKLKDSKKLNSLERNRLCHELVAVKKSGDVDFAVASKSAEYIDQFGIQQAVQACIQQCLSALLRKGNSLDACTSKIYLDGALKIDQKYIQQIRLKYSQELQYEVVVKGDETIPAIACSSIVAKVMRDIHMTKLQQRLYKTEGKKYGFETNAGYGTKDHYTFIQKNGITKYHRKSFLTKL